MFLTVAFERLKSLILGVKEIKAKPGEKFEKISKKKPLLHKITEKKHGM